MDDLKVPEILAGTGVQSQQAVGVKVGSLAIGAVKVIGGRTDREIRDPSLLIDRYPAPGVGPANVLPRIFRPRVVTHVAGMRNGMKSPDELSGDAHRTHEDHREENRIPRRW